MARAFDFAGGIHPPERKTLSTSAPLSAASLPARVVLPLKQHSGNAALACVEPGQYVRTGECIARRDGMISADLHASISGHVAELTDTQITIVGDGCDEWLLMPVLDWRTTDSRSLLERLDESGVVGLGGAGFPTQIKARVRERHALDTLIVNAAECEPYITADDMTLRSFALEVLEGAQLMAHLAGAERILIGIEDNKPEAVAVLNQALNHSTPLPVELKVIATRYPSGGERQLIKKLLDREVPSGGLPADVGVLCHNPGTLLAALQAVRDGTPLVSRILTLTGEALARPANVTARLGTSIGALLQTAGLEEKRLFRLIQGGPMMGTTLESLELPVTKATNCLIAATQEELPPSPPEQPCIRCGACEEVCPAALLPQQLHWYARAEQDERLSRYHLFDCIECGACSYVCPSHIPLVEDYRNAKQRIRYQQLETAKAEHARHRFEFRQARLAREEAEKQARREARRNTGRRATPASSTSAGQADLQGLRIAQAAAKAAVKKAEKVLMRTAQQDPHQDLSDLETQVATARENLEAAEARLASARAETAPDIPQTDKGTS
ncbi:electron transport complex subunit RsxC [Vreelandella rituensis]|uniref:Ion-translocating oxidoreductase complex subunit C n=1 Tax=Vreelandella rituensis TaxID=2282306 RepID=A0A368U626_9GAMM|nr:electron transport complex subunit RsxC [Halomonas rituensis]RCV92599.1 electron transport complex subunit RsxC [Halomonas rituensis]